MQELAVRREIERNASGVISLVVIPAVFGLLGAYTDKLDKAIGGFGLVLCWGLAILLLGFFAVRLHLPERSVMALLVDNEDLADEKTALLSDRRELEVAINLLSLQVNYCESVRGVTLAHLRRKISSCEDLKTAIGDVAAPVYYKTEEFFGCGASERWSFTVYLFSKNTEALLPIWRRAATNFPSNGHPRIWRMGQGHVGKAFVDQRLIITGDATSAEIADFSAVPPLMSKPHDAGLYVSFASIPIGPILEQDGRPYGVLVGTSDEHGRFDAENSAILVQIAGALASLLIAGHLDVDDIVKVGAGGALEDMHGGSSGPEQTENTAGGDGDTAVEKR